jgi:hypothetical protein
MKTKQSLSLKLKPSLNLKPKLSPNLRQNPSLKLKPISKQTRAVGIAERMKMKINSTNFRKPLWRQNHDQ